MLFDLKLRKKNKKVELMVYENDVNSIGSVDGGLTEERPEVVYMSECVYSDWLEPVIAFWRTYRMSNLVHTYIYLIDGYM